MSSSLTPAFATRPVWPPRSLAPANSFLHPNAHDAMADVEASIFLAKLMKEKTPWLLDHLLRMGQKVEAVRRLIKWNTNEYNLKYIQLTIYSYNER